MTTVLWQQYIFGSWHPIASDACDEIEHAFATATHGKLVHISPNPFSTSQLPKLLDVEEMVWGEVSIRRAHTCNNLSHSFFYWNDDDWVEFDAESQTTMSRALEYGRHKVTVCPHRTQLLILHIDLIDMTQENPRSDTRRAIKSVVTARVSARVPSVAPDALKDTAELQLLAGGKQFYCPITQTPMLQPVVASDGMCYEREAIEKWLQNGNNTSPISGVPLMSTLLYPAQNLRNIMQTMKDTEPQRELVQQHLSNREEQRLKRMKRPSA